MCVSFRSNDKQYTTGADKQAHVCDMCACVYITQFLRLTVKRPINPIRCVAAAGGGGSRKMGAFKGVHLHHIARETDDVKRLVRFYQEVLGFEHVETPSFGALEVVWLSLPPLFSLHIIHRNPEARLPESPLNSSPDSKKDPSSLPAGHHLAFCVEDYDACINTLKDMHIPIFEKTQQDGRIKQAFFFDPDGNGLEIGNWPIPSS